MTISINTEGYGQDKLDKLLAFLDGESIQWTGKPPLLHWKHFDIEKPEPMQEIFIVWPSGSFKPEYRKLTADELKNDWSKTRWLPVPNYK